jgi:hypothetical protein
MLMCRLITLAVAAALIVAAAATEGAEEKKIEAPIKNVTVYPDRAQITRRAELDLPSGEFTLTIDSLPGGVIDASLRASVDGIDGLTLQRLSHRRQEHLTAQPSQVAALEAEIEGLDRHRRQVVSDRLETLNQLRRFVAALGESATRVPKGDETDQKIEVANWITAYDFIGSHSFNLGDSIRQTKQELEDVNAQVSLLRSRLGDLVSSDQRVSKSVSIDVKLERAGKVRMTLEYIIPGAQWTPLYDARIKDDPDSVEFTCHAEVSQTTGEDWEEVELTLSTARPSLGAGPGELSPWLLAEVFLPGTRSYGGSTGQIQGRLTSADDGEPVVGASVMVVGTTQGAVSDIHGNFQILRVDPGVYTLRISSVDFTTTEVTDVTVTPETTFSFSSDLVAKQATDLNKTITVVGSQDKLQKFVVASQVEIQGESIKSRPVQTVDNLLEQVAGVRTTAEGQIFVRGGHGNEAAYIVDGVELSGAPRYSASPFPTVFKIKRAESISSGGETARVTVAEWLLQGRTKLTCRPQITSVVFRLVSVTNQQETPLLPGDLSVFAGPNYLGRTRIERIIAPAEEFELPFGPDDHITVERKLVNVKKIQKGNKVRLERTVRIILQNHGLDVRMVDLEELRPISQDSRIDVKVGPLVPTPVSQDEDGLIKWEVNLVPGVEVVVDIPYEISYPSGLQISGL